MKRLACLLLLIPTISLAQRNSPNTQQPIYVFDSNGAQIGEAVTDSATSARINYPLPNGETVTLLASAAGLSSDLKLNGATWFQTSDCSGDIFVNEQWATLTLRQAAIVRRTSDVSVALYVTDKLPHNSPVPFNTLKSSTFVLNGVVNSGSCQPIDAVGAPPGATLPLMKFTHVEDLTTKYSPPFYLAAH